MSWLNHVKEHFYARLSRFNNSLCLNRRNITTYVESVDTIFDPLKTTVEEFSSLMMFPFNITPIVRPAYKGYLNTSKGVTSIEAYEIDGNCNYFNFGQHYVEPYYNNFADYKGYTYIKAYLPFVGYQDIDVNECMGKWLQFRLLVDYANGRGMFVVGVSDNEITFADSTYPTTVEDENVRVIGTYDCTVGTEMPLGRSNAGDIMRNMWLGAAKTYASYGMSVLTSNAAPSTTTETSTVTHDVMGRGSYKGARLKTMERDVETKSVTRTHHKPVDKTKPISEVIDGSIEALNRLSTGGASDRINSGTLMWDMSTEVIIVYYRPKFVEQPAEYGNLYGYPLGEVKKLSELSGYTEINSIHFEGTGFNKILNSEIAMLEDIFSNGVLL